MPVIDKAQLGMKRETTYGTRVVPDSFFEFQSESLTFDQRFHVSTQLGSGAMAPRGSRRKPTTKDAAGNIVMEVPNKGFGKLLDLFHDNVITPVQQGTTTAYLQTHNTGLTAPSSKFVTIQVNRPDAGNTDRPFDYVGALLTEAEFGLEVDGALTTTLTFDCQDEKTDQTLAVRSLPTGLESFVFTEGTMQIAGGTVADVTNFSITIPFGRQTDFYPLASTGLKAKPVQNAITAITGTATSRFSDLTQYNRFKNNTQVSLSLSCTTASLAGVGHPFNITMLANQVGFTGSTPVIGGPDVLTFDMPFEVYFDGTNAPLIVTYKSTDVTV